MAIWFNIYEFTKSDTAKRLKIDNTPNEQQMDNLIHLMQLMDKIREKWTAYCKEHFLPNPQIIINSGFRSEALNKAVGGSKTSYHMKGMAADFDAKNGHNGELFRLILDMIGSGEIVVSQLIWEQGDNSNPDWIHIALYDGNKKNDILRYEKGKGYRKYCG